MSEDLQAEEGYVFKVVYYMAHDDARACNLWTRKFRREADRIRFFDARIPNLLGLNARRGNVFYAQQLGDTDLDRSMYEVFAFRVREPSWFWRKKEEGEEILNQELEFPQRHLPDDELHDLSLEDAINLAEPDSLLAHHLLAEQLMATVAKVGLERLQLSRASDEAPAR